MTSSFNPVMVMGKMTYHKSDINNLKNFLNGNVYNTGNTYITYSMLKMMYGYPKNIPNYSTFDMLKSNLNEILIKANEINSTYTHCLIQFEDSLRSDWTLWENIHLKEFINAIKIPIVPFSLGSNTGFILTDKIGAKPDYQLPHINEYNLSTLKLLSEKCVKLGIRGEFTAKIFDKYGIKNYNIVGCPTFFEMGSEHKIDLKSNSEYENIMYNGYIMQLIPSIARDKRIHYINNSPDFFTSLQYYNSEFENINDIENAVTVQDISKGRHPADFHKFDWINWSFDEYITLLKDDRIHVFSNIYKWQSYLRNKKFKFGFGSRVHGGVIAINAGVPLATFDIDSRSTEMFNFLNIPIISNACDFVHGQQLNLDDIYSKIDYTMYNKNYKKLHNNFINWMKENNLPVYDVNKNVDNELQEYAQLPCVSERNDKTNIDKIKLLVSEQRNNIIKISLQEEINYIKNEKENILNELNSTKQDISQLQQEQKLYKKYIKIDNKIMKIFPYNSVRREILKAIYYLMLGINKIINRAR